MPILPQARLGELLTIKKNTVNFSFWPMGKTTRRFGVQTVLYASEPWSVIRQSINDKCPSADRPATHAFLTQSQEFFEAATSGKTDCAKPLLLYYSFLNLVKAYLLTFTTRTHGDFDGARHGISEKLPTGGSEIIDAHLECYPSPTSSGKLNIFDEFYTSVMGKSIATITDYKVPHLLPQILPGHRLWADSQNERQRFFRLSRIELMQNRTSKEIWLRLYVREGDLTHWKIAHVNLLSEANFSSTFKEVQSNAMLGSDHLLCFEQDVPLSYSHRAADKVSDLVEQHRNDLWVTATTIAPYRAYYLYMSPASEASCRLPQLLSIYAIMFYLGSVTRYRPHQFISILEGKYASQIYGILTSQPRQFLYLMASNFARQEVATQALI